MFTVQLEKPKNLIKHDQSLFVSFDYDSETVSKIKSLPIRHYVPSDRCWEIPVDDLALILDLFKDREITLKGAMVKGAKPAKKAEVVHPVVIDVTGFDFKTEPFEHQIEAFQYANDHEKFLLGDEQGLGKTKQAIDVAIARSDNKFFKHCLIVCGVNGLKHNWMKEIGIHSNEKGRILGSYFNRKGQLEDGTVKERLADLDKDLEEFFLITNIETLRSKEIATKLEKLTKSGVIGMVVIDEIHKCKNPQSQQGKAIHSLKSRFKLAMTGTPLMNEPIDLFNLLKWIDVEKHSFYAFRSHYCTMGGYGGYEVVGYKNLEQLRSILDLNMLRRKKDEVLDLPPKIRSTEFVEMTAKQAQLYKEVKNEIVANLDQIKLNPNPLALLIRLRQATGHTSILSTKINESAKLERLLEMVEEIASNGKKAVIFSNWTSMTDLIVPALKQFSPAVVTGQVSDRQGEVDRFQTEPQCKVIIGTIGAMGTGLTLTAASTVIFLDKPWNRALTDQAEDRAHRIGTSGTVNIVTLVCRNTIDEKIEEIIREKGDMADALVDGDWKKLKASDVLDRLLT